MTPSSDSTRLSFLGILGLLMMFTSLSVDIYLPAMPIMQAQLGGQIELTLTGFLFGFTLAQLIWGPISDRIGRKKPLYAGMLLFAAGSVGCALASTLNQVVFWRVFQALGACTGPMLARAMIRDCFERTQAARMLSTLMLIMAAAPILGPLLGGQLVALASWHWIFWFLASMGVLMCTLLFRLPETLPASQRSSEPLGRAFASYGFLLRHGPFMRHCLCLTFYYVGAFAFIAGSPKVYIGWFGVTERHYGWLFALNIVGLMAMSLLNRQLVQRFSLDALVRLAAAGAALAGLMVMVGAKFYAHSLLATLVPVVVFFSMNGVLSAATIAAALDGVPHIAGAASALIGAMQYGSGMLSSVILAYLGHNTPWDMAWVMGLFSVLSAFTAYWPARRA